MRCSRDTVETGDGTIAPDHQPVLPQLAQCAERYHVVVAHRRRGLRNHGQRLTDAIPSTIPRKRDVAEPLGCKRQIVLPHGPFISCTPEVVDRTAADATEEGEATVALLDQMRAGAEGSAVVVGTDKIVIAGCRL